MPIMQHQPSAIQYAQAVIIGFLQLFAQKINFPVCPFPFCLSFEIISRGPSTEMKKAHEGAIVFLFCSYLFYAHVCVPLSLALKWEVLLLILLPKCCLICGWCVCGDGNVFIVCRRTLELS